MGSRSGDQHTGPVQTERDDVQLPHPPSGMALVLLDFWGVIGVVQSAESVAGMAQRIGAPVADFSAAYWQYREAHDAGGSAADFWTEVADELGVDRDETAVADLIELDVASWLGVHQDMLQLLREWHESGRRMALLSNAPRELKGHASQVLSGLVPQLVFSCDLGVAKPEPQAFEMALDQLGVTAGEVVFIDDNPGNVRAAQACGIAAVQHVSVESTRAALRSLRI
jgi:putative hydrolase of the HAD superfamily